MKIFLLLALATLLVGCGTDWNQPFFGPTQAKPAVPAATLTPSAPPVATATSKPTVTATKAVTTTTSNTNGAVAVVTPTPMQDLGQLLGNQPMTPNPGPTIVWDHLLKISQWREDRGLTGVKVLYAQSSKPSEVDLPLLPNTTAFTVPSGSTLVFGAFSAKVTLGNDKTFALSDGFYGAISENTTIKTLRVKDGFVLLAGRDDAQKEYCKRIAQAVNEKWAREHLYRPISWSEPVCQGVVTTPIGDFR